jgi:hypothetical protein
MGEQKSMKRKREREGGREWASGDAGEGGQERRGGEREGGGGERGEKERERDLQGLDSERGVEGAGVVQQIDAHPGRDEHATHTHTFLYA